jgi:hypothetical protein
MRVVFSLLLVSLINCQAESLSNLNVRYISEGIPCVNDNACLSKVDNFLEAGLTESIQWSELSRSDSLIYFFEYTPLTEFATILVVDNINVETEQKKIIRLGSDDGIRIFVNGEEVYRNILGRGINADSDWIPVTLKAGTNQIIFQVNQNQGNWALHYQIDYFENISDLFVGQAFDLYADLPSSYILRDEITSVALNIDPRSKLDNYNTISFTWKTPEGEVLNEQSYLGSQLPSYLELPEFSSFAILEYEVRNNSDVIYSEQVPIFKQSYVNNTVFELYNDDRLHPKWVEGFYSVFGQKLVDEATRAYSTRMKAEFLWDVLNELDPFEYQIAGARTELFNNELARRYTPQRPTDKKMVGLNIDFWDQVQQYMESQVAYSHALLAQWNSYAQYYGVELFFPFASNEIEELNADKVLDAYVSTYADSFSVVVWSKSTASIIEALNQKPYPIKEVVVISPWVLDSPTENFTAVHNIFKNNPQVRWSVYRGDNDVEVTELVVKEWMEMIEEAGMTCKFKPIPFTGHWVHWVEPLETYLSRRNI